MLYITDSELMCHWDVEAWYIPSVNQVFASETQHRKEFWCSVSNFGNAALVCNKKKNFTGSFDLLAVSNDTISLTGMIVMFNRQAWCLDVFEEILLWIVWQNINKNKDSPCFRLVCFCRISLRPNKITGMSPESALCFHTVIITAALRAALGFISTRTVDMKVLKWVSAQLFNSAV